MSSSTQQTSGSSFRRARVVRVASGVASVGVLAALGLVGATPAAADPICGVANTVDGAAGPGAIQSLIDLNVAEICLTGTFTFTAVTGPLHFTNDLLLFGSPYAVLDGTLTTNLLVDDDQDTLTVQNLTLRNGFTLSDGGAIDGYYVNTIDSVFEDNSANGFGGAINSYSAQSTRTVFEGNAGGFGGGIHAQTYAGAVDSTFRNNDGGIGGGGISSYGAVDSYSSTFDDNTSTEVGGGIYADDSLWVENSTFVDNTSRVGGAVFAYDGTVVQSTFVTNSASIDGNSVATTAGEGMQLRGNIFSGLGGPELFTYSTPMLDLGGNLFTSASEPAMPVSSPSSIFGLTIALLFGGNTLANNGGFTDTVALPSTSVALDVVPAGEPSVEFDQRGVARSAVSDAGAFEYGVKPAALAATGAVPATWLGGVAALLLAAGVAVFASTRRFARTR